MNYVIVTGANTITGKPARSYDAAFAQAIKAFGDDVSAWLKLNLRIEENR